MEYYTPKEAAILLKIDDNTIRYYINHGDIKALKFSNRWMIEKKELERFINGRKK